MPKALRLRVAVAENPTVRRNGGSGWRLSALSFTSRATGCATPRRVRVPWTRARSAASGSTRVETNSAVGWSFASSRFPASVASFHLVSPRSTRAIGTEALSEAVVQSSGSKTSVPVLPETVPMALEKPAWLIANITRVCTGSSR